MLHLPKEGKWRLVKTKFLCLELKLHHLEVEPWLYHADQKLRPAILCQGLVRWEIK